MKEILLKGRNIGKVFEQENQKTQVLMGVDVDIYQEDFTIIMGPSGLSLIHI